MRWRGNLGPKIQIYFLCIHVGGPLERGGGGTRHLMSYENITFTKMKGKARDKITAGENIYAFKVHSKTQ